MRALRPSRCTVTSPCPWCPRGCSSVSIRHPCSTSHFRNVPISIVTSCRWLASAVELLKPFDFEFLTGVTQHRKPFLQEVAELRNTKKIASSSSIIGARCLFPNRRPVPDGIIIPSKPGQSDEVDLLVLRKRVDQRCYFLDNGVVGLILQHRCILVIRRVRGRIAFTRLFFHVA